MARKKKQTEGAAPTDDAGSPNAPVAVPLAQRQIVYPTPLSIVYHGATAMTIQQVKDMLGWTEEGEYNFGTDYLLRDRNGVKIRCLNNGDNRPFYEGDCETLVQEHLNTRWHLNGEAIIISRTARVLSGQHRGIAFLLAEQDRLSEKRGAKWREAGHTAPLTLATFVSYGISDDDAVVNTVDTGKSRTLADVLFRSPHFTGLKPSAKKKLSRVADHAVRKLWDRTGAAANPFAPRRTHAESMDFILRHPRIIEAVRHIHEEYGSDDRRKVNSRLMSPGYAAAMLYMMAAGKSNGDEYRKAHPRKESDLDMGLWDKACAFWRLLAKGDLSLLELRHAVARLVDAQDGSGGANLTERTCLIILAWRMYARGEALTEKGLHLPSKVNDDGIRVLLKPLPILEGIDMGDDSGGDPDDDAPTNAQLEELAKDPAEIERRAAEARAQTEAEAEAKRQQKIADTKKRLLANRAAEKAAKEAAKNGNGATPEQAPTPGGPPVPRKKEAAPG